MCKMDGEVEKEIFERQINFSNLNPSFNADGKLSLKRLSLRNPILKATFQSSILSNVSNTLNSDLHRKEREELFALYKQREKDRRIQEEFDEKLNDAIINITAESLKSKIDKEDLPTPVFPTSIDISEAPNYYIFDPPEKYKEETKRELIRMLSELICGTCGNRIYGLYVPEEGFELKEMLKDWIPDFYKVSISSIAKVGRLNPRQIGPFEYLFYLLDMPLKEMYKRNTIPSFHVELLVCQGIGRGKKSFSHYIIPGLSELYYKLYHGKSKYSPWGGSKIKALISSFIVENWKIENREKENISEIAHSYINRFLYYLLVYKTLDMDSIIFLEDLKIKKGDKTPVLFLDEVVSWI